MRPLPSSAPISQANAQRVKSLSKLSLMRRSSSSKTSRERCSLIKLLNTSDHEVIDFAYDYLHANAETTLYPPAEAVENLIKMSGYMDKNLHSISAKIGREHV